MSGAANTLIRNRPGRVDRRGGGTAIQKPNGYSGAIGNSAHVPDPDIAWKVEALSSLGNSIDAIALAVDIDPKTITKYYRDELTKGTVNANLKVGTAILSSAMGEREPCEECDGEGMVDDGGALCAKCKGSGHGRGWIREPNTTAQIWWSKNRMGWTDKERIEHVGDGGGPVITEQRSSADTVKARLAMIAERIKKSEEQEGE